MTAFIIKRLLGIGVTLILIITVVFFLVRLAPGGPFDQDRQVPAEVLADPRFEEFLERLDLPYGPTRER